MYRAFKMYRISLVPRLSCVGEESLVHTICTCSVPQNFWEFGNFCKICSVTLTSARHTNFFCIKKMPATDHALRRRWWGNYEGTHLFACRSCPRVHPFQLNTVVHEWWKLSLWSSLITSKEAINYHQNDNAFDFKTTRMCPTGSITMQCDLSGGKKKLTIILM